MIISQMCWVCPLWLFMIFVIEESRNTDSIGAKLWEFLVTPVFRCNTPMPDYASKSGRTRIIILFVFWSSSLMKNCGFVANPNCDININAINTKNSRILINLLAMFDEIIERSYEELEPSVLTNYLFELKYSLFVFLSSDYWLNFFFRSAINRANQELTIKGQDVNIAQTRLLLFVCAHNVFNQCMKLLGIQPLESM